MLLQPRHTDVLATVALVRCRKKYKFLFGMIALLLDMLFLGADPHGRAAISIFVHFPPKASPSIEQYRCQHH